MTGPQTAPPRRGRRAGPRRYGCLVSTVGSAVRVLTRRAARASCVALLGPNGAGKTSTLDVCTGFARPDAGTVRVLGLDPWRQSGELRPRIGVMLQAGGSHAAARAGEMLEVIAALLGAAAPAPAGCWTCWA